MNKEKFTAELVCLLDVASLPQDIADFKAEVESFFIAGAARIDLIAKVMDLDNDIGGYMFDIPLLEETEKAIADVNKSPGIKTQLRKRVIGVLCWFLRKGLRFRYSSVDDKESECVCSISRLRVKQPLKLLSKKLFV